MVRCGISGVRAIKQALCLALSMTILAGCQTMVRVESPSAEGPVEAETTDANRASADESAIGASFAQSLDQAIRDGWREGHLLVECHRDGRLQSVEIFARGVGIWDRARQFRLSPAQIQEVLVTLRDGGFATMDAVYGGRPPMETENPGDPSGQTEPKHQGFVVVCQVEVEIDGRARAAVQRRRGEQSEPLRRLALTLLDLSAEEGRAGVAADSVARGLQMLADGTLEPEVWSLMFHRKPAGGDANAPGWLMRIDGLRVTTQEYRPGTGYGPPRVRALSREQMATLAARIAEAHPESLLQNLWAEEYTDLVIELLDHRAGIQARPFSGMDRSTHGEAQAGFDQLVAHLQALLLDVIQ